MLFRSPRNTGYRTFLFLPETGTLLAALPVSSQTSGSGSNYRPSILPYNFCQKSLAPHTSMVLTASRGEHHHIPVPVLILHQIPMPSIDHRIIRPKIPMCKDRIARASLKPLKQLSASRHTDAVFRSGSSFCMQQIIIAVFFVQM